MTAAQLVGSAATEVRTPLASPPRSIDEARVLLADRASRFVTVAYVDLAGALRGKLMSRERFTAALENGFNIVQASYVLDPTDVQLETPGVFDDQATFRDIAARVIPETACVLPWAAAGEELMFLAEAADDRGFLCPRRLFQRVEAWAVQRGFLARYGNELEFTLFTGSIRDAKAANYASLSPITIDRTYDSVVREQANSELFSDFIAMCSAADIPMEALHWEMGPGFLEAAFRSGVGVSGCDKIVLFKNLAKVVAQRRALFATFMARWSNEYDGQGGHIHMSLCDMQHQPLFHDPAASESMSTVFRHFIGGVQTLLPELFALFAPNVNSYKRLSPGIFAPTRANWGVENRTCALRVIAGGPGSMRVEFRVPGADANPYLATAALLLAGVHGVTQRIEPLSPAVTRNAYSESDVAPPFPASLLEAARLLRTSRLARDVLGEEFVAAFAASRESQARQFERLVTDVERNRFLELG